MKEKIIKSEGVTIAFQEFQDAISKLNDKKAHGIDGLPLNYFKKIGIQRSYKMFCDWSTLKLSKRENDLLSTARVVFLSKTNKEIISDHSEYRCLAI